MTVDEMAGWHHQPNGHEAEKALQYGEGQGSLACYRTATTTIYIYILYDIYTSYIHMMYTCVCV